ncbi:MAG: DUF2207 domain-containing protein, partial [Propionibacteriaceae bacterium]|nr:DUF2207 domain-containing protein [Propionibacteriaceae bacterium]
MFRYWRRWIIYPICWLAAVGLTLFVIAVLARPGKTSADMESFDATYTTFASAHQVGLEVTETIVVDLRRERGIIRSLVQNYAGASLGLSALTAESGDGSRYPVSVTTRRNGVVEYRIGDPGKRLSGRHTFVLRYRMANAMVAAGDKQELYLNTNGLEWSNGFRRFSARLEIGDDLAAKLDGTSACYYGPAGSRLRCELTREGNAFVVSRKGIGPRENVTLAVGFQPGTVSDPLPQLKAASWGWWGIASLVGVGAVSLLVSLVMRALVRDVKSSDVAVVTEYRPPEGISPIAAADFLGRPERGPAAHLTWLVLRGNATIHDRRDQGQAPGQDRDRISAAEQRRLGKALALSWKTVPAFDSPRLKNITAALFGGPDLERALERLHGGYDPARAAVLRRDYLDGLWLRHRLGIGGPMLILGMVLLIGLGVVQAVLGLAGLGWYFLGAGILGVLLLIAAVHYLPTYGGLTPKGKQLRHHLMGLRQFVTMAEANRIAWLQNALDAPAQGDVVKLYEPLLPYAIIFGVEDSWRRLIGHSHDAFGEQQGPAPVRLAAAVADSFV